MPFIQLQFRRGTAASWTAQNPILAAGEMAIESDTHLFKIGDGVTRWNSIPYGGLQGPTGASGGGGGGGGSTGYTGPTGSTGTRGPTGEGSTGPTGVSGDKYLSATTSIVSPNPQSGSVDLTIGAGLSYIKGNSVVVVDLSGVNRFEGYVSTYNSVNGQITISNIVNIIGTFLSPRVYNINLDGIDGPTGSTGSTGATGQTGATGKSGDKYLTATNGAVTPQPSLGSVTFTVDTGLSYITGNSVVVVHQTIPTIRFEGTIQTYNTANGSMTINPIVNISGTFVLSVYNVNLDGIDGPTGSTGPTGASGSVTVYSITFDGGLSNNSYVSGPAFDCGSSV